MAIDALPALFQAQLDQHACAALFRDLAALGQALEVSVKQGERVLIEECPSWTLEAARAALAAGQVRAVQVRYVHEGVEWIDTIIESGAGYRVVRMPQASVGSTAHGG